MRKALIVLGTMIATAISGCASFNQQGMNAKAAPEIKGQTVTSTTREKPDFAAMTPGKATFAVIGAVAMISEGNSIISTHNVADPADEIAIGLATELKKAYGMRLVTPPIKVGADDPAQIASSSKDAVRYVIDAKTINWSIGYFPTDWTHYRTIYTAKARLINLQTKDVVAEGFCKHIPESNVNAPTYDELIGNQASRLKSHLNTIAQECINSMKTQMLTGA